MSRINGHGHVDEKHQLIATVPPSVPAGPVTVLIVPSSREDGTGDGWMTGVAREWADDLNNERQDIYMLSDGEPLRESVDLGDPRA